MNRRDRPAYNDSVADLVDRATLNELGPGKADRTQHARLARISPEQILAPHPVRDREMAAACLAGLWLLYDFLDESHTISQSLDSVEGSYWHGIMHRREPDYENAKYWFPRVPAHPLSARLASAARELAATPAPDPLADFLRAEKQWDAPAFVDLCRAVAGGRSTSGQLCRQVQRLEWQMLFDHCWRQAGGEA